MIRGLIGGSPGNRGSANADVTIALKNGPKTDRDKKHVKNIKI